MTPSKTPTPSWARRGALRARVLVRRVTGRPPLPKARYFGPPDTSWSDVQPDPEPVVPLATDEVTLHAILCTWRESDIVESTVRNALRQGCERVLMVDNASPDDTVAVATAAGAELARSFDTKGFDERRRFDLMHEVIDEVSEAGPHDHVWWLFLDADEFSHGPAGTTLAEHVLGLDRRFRVVGARVFNHYPSEPPYHVAGEHPLDHQPLAEEARWPFCTLEHHKHPLFRWDRGGPPIRVGNGFHMASSDGPLVETEHAVLLHHFPFRDKARSRERLDALFDRRADPKDEAADHMYARHRSLEAVYAQDWANVENHMTRGLGVSPRPWSELVDPADLSVARWY
jgi:hypothetical protein